MIEFLWPVLAFILWLFIGFVFCVWLLTIAAVLNSRTESKKKVK